MKNMCYKGYRICLWLMLVFSALIFWGSLGCMSHGESVFWGVYGGIFQVVIAVVASIFTGMLLLKLYSYGKKIGDTNSTVIWIGLGLIVLLQICYYCFVSRTAPTTDAARVMNEALAMLRQQNGQLNMELKYFQHYHNNHYVVVFLYFFYWGLSIVGIHDVWIPTIILNVICIDLGIFISYFSIRKIKGIQGANLFLILCMLCPTTYVWITFAYTNTFSIPFVMGCLYLYLVIREKNVNARCICLCVLLGICMVVGCMVRITTIIPIIAIALYEMISRFLLKDVENRHAGWLQSAKKAGIVCVTMLVVFAGLSSIKARHVEDVYKEEQLPITHWLMMGAKDCGQYDGRDVAYTNRFPTRKEKRKANLEMIGKRLGEAGVPGTLDLIVKKLEGVWSIGADDVLDKGRSCHKYPALYPYFMGNQNQWFVVYLQVFRIVTLFFLLVSVWNQIRQHKFESIFLYTLTFLGAVTFFGLWEANHKYSICFMYLCLMLMADGINVFAKKVSVLEEKYRYGRRGLHVGMFVWFLLLVVLWNAGPVKKYNSDVVYAYYVERSNVAPVQSIQKNVRVLEQTIQAGKAGDNQDWNWIKVFFRLHRKKNTPEKEYRISVISNENQNVLYTEKIGRKDIERNGAYCLEIPKALMWNKGEYYRIRIERLSNKLDMFPIVVDLPQLDTYPYGRLSLDGSKVKCDLRFELYREE